MPLAQFHRKSEINIKKGVSSLIVIISSAVKFSPRISHNFNSQVRRCSPEYWLHPPERLDGTVPKVLRRGSLPTLTLADQPT